MKNLAIINRNSVWVNFAADHSLAFQIYAGFPEDGTNPWERPPCQLSFKLPVGFQDGQLTFEITEDSMCLVHEHKACESAPKCRFRRIFCSCSFVAKPFQIPAATTKLHTKARTSSTRISTHRHRAQGRLW